ncbi:MAG: hypothetical protein N7Q72_01175, partial [Spiroplasma sp. Tabriz.8]|nr:hypothetical protein [Spiroplasma sp. Tabriz.8]
MHYGILGSIYDYACAYLLFLVNSEALYIYIYIYIYCKKRFCFLLISLLNLDTFVWAHYAVVLDITMDYLLVLRVLS